MADNAPGLENISFQSTSTYTIVQELGRGGMGIVYLAEKNCEGVIDHVVLKTIRSISPKQIERLKQEANIATVLRHENIVKTYGLEAIPIAILPQEFREQIAHLSTGTGGLDKSVELEKSSKYMRPRLVPPKGSAAAKNPLSALKRSGIGGLPLGVRASMSEDEKLYCLAMDYVEGTDLGHIFRDHLRADLLLPCPLTGFIMSRVCRALAYAHQYIVHRDISPENIMVNTHGVTKLADFGIAVAAGKQTEFAGKLHYMSPEQLHEGDLDGRSDIFALGLVAYQMLTGINLMSPPRDVGLEEAVRIVDSRMKRPITPPHLIRPDIPEILSLIVTKMLVADKNQRYQDMEDCGNDLEKKYLYASGFGPTNNSLAAYLRIFDKDFNDIPQNDLKQLTFLKNPETGKIALRRLFSYDTYTPAGQALIKETQRDQLMFKVLKRQAAAASGAAGIGP